MMDQWRRFKQTGIFQVLLYMTAATTLSRPPSEIILHFHSSEALLAKRKGLSGKCYLSFAFKSKCCSSYDTQKLVQKFELCLCGVRLVICS